MSFRKSTCERKESDGGALLVVAINGKLYTTLCIPKWWCKGSDRVLLSVTSVSVRGKGREAGRRKKREMWSDFVSRKVTFYFIPFVLYISKVFERWFIKPWMTIFHYLYNWIKGFFSIYGYENFDMNCQGKVLHFRHLFRVILLLR